MAGTESAGTWGPVLITGGGGFLGSHLVDAFVALPQVGHVTATGRDRSKPRKHVPGATFEICDVRDIQSTQALLARVKPKLILHTISPGPFATKKLHLEATYHATKNLVEAARLDPNVQAFIYTSSIEACPLGHVSSPLLEENAQVNDLSTDDYWYRRTKGAADTLVRAASTPKQVGAKDWSGALLTCCLRAPGIYGPSDNMITPAMLAMVNTPGARIQWGSDDTKTHEWLYVDNAVSAHVLAAGKLMGNASGVSGEAFFITDGKAMTFNRFTRALWKAAGDENMNSPGPKFTVVPFWLIYSLLAVWEVFYRAATFGRGWPYVSRQNFSFIREGICLSIDKARTRLGYEPHVSTEEGIFRTVKAFQDEELKEAN